MLKKIQNKNVDSSIVATDCVLFTWTKSAGLLVATVETSFPDLYNHKRALPGGLILKDETAEESIVRNLDTKAGIKNHYYIEQLATFSALSRDPRNRVVSVAFLGCIAFDSIPEAAIPTFIPYPKLGKLAYDHNEITKVGLDRLRSKIHYSTIISKLLPPVFTLNDLQSAYEVILGKAVDKRNFRKKILSLDLLSETGNMYSEGAFRPAMLYSFKKSGMEFLSVF